METNNKVYYRSTGKEVEVFRLANELRHPVLLKGPTGCGKSRFVEKMAEDLGRPLIEVACHEETSAVDLVGRFILKGGETIWQDGPIPRAMREGAILYLDEIAEAREDVVVVLHSLSDHRRSLFIERTGEKLIAPPEFMLVVSYNPGYQRNLKELKPSTKQRFLALEFNYPQEDAEIEIIVHETGTDAAFAKKMVQFARKVRELKEIEVRETISTRLLIATAGLIRKGLPVRLAFEVGVVQPLSDDKDVVQALNDLVALYF
jgi:nitric oxide reductase NorQ protein